MSNILIQSLLGDTGDVAEWAEDKLSPEDLTKLSEEPASVLWVVRFVRRVHIGCWVMRWVRNFRLWLAVGLGLSLGIEAVGFIAIRAMINEQRVMMRESQRATVIQTLKELKVISSLPPPAGETVVTLLGGTP